ATVDWASISTPPRFVHEPNGPILYYKVEKHGTEQSKAPDNLFQITIRCVAEGNPNPSYRWFKDGKPFNAAMYPEKLVQIPDEGTLIFTKLDESDAGTYQCQAMNDNGTAVSFPTKLEQTLSDRYLEKIHVCKKNHLTCEPSHLGFIGAETPLLIRKE
ncbi:unnamed protein product, partial [Haemonchus placei]|uniref:Ig-like domain-containing protein n=1 Tax=Haemonchus placei TaxID=6290 RepID=A0A0N4WSM1_HAEPC